LDAVKEILLFRSLDTQQLSEVLDAMFERRVKAGDYIIKQGDDGDNFYVVDRYKHFFDFYLLFLAKNLFILQLLFLFNNLSDKHSKLFSLYLILFIKINLLSISSLNIKLCQMKT